MIFESKEIIFKGEESINVLLILSEHNDFHSKSFNASFVNIMDLVWISIIRAWKESSTASTSKSEKQKKQEQYTWSENARVSSTKGLLRILYEPNPCDQPFQEILPVYLPSHLSLFSNTLLVYIICISLNKLFETTWLTKTTLRYRLSLLDLWYHLTTWASTLLTDDFGHHRQLPILMMVLWGCYKFSVIAFHCFQIILIQIRIFKSQLFCNM